MTKAAPPGLAAADFLDLGEFAHAALFHGTERVWDALARLGPYLAALAPGRIEGVVEPGAWLVGDGIRIGPGSVVEAGAYIRGPCVIGRDTEVRHGAYLRGNVVVGDRCIIGHATEAKSSIFLDGAKAGHFAYVGDSILGTDVNLGAGTKLANLRLGGGEVSVFVGAGAGSVATGRRKLGAILGDGVETGCNSVLNPGTLLGRRARVWPCAAVAGFHPEGSLVGAPHGRG